MPATEQLPRKRKTQPPSVTRSPPAKKIQLIRPGLAAQQQRNSRPPLQNVIDLEESNPYERHENAIADLVVRGLPYDEKHLHTMSFFKPKFIRRLMKHLPTRNSNLYEYWYDDRGMTFEQLACFMTYIVLRL